VFAECSDNANGAHETIQTVFCEGKKEGKKEEKKSDKKYSRTKKTKKSQKREHR